jgi:hypothetical protein
MYFVEPLYFCTSSGSIHWHQVSYLYLYDTSIARTQNSKFCARARISVRYCRE